MLRPLMTTAALTFLFAAPAFAEPVPQAALDKDYETCLGGLSGVPQQQDPQREQYCACVRDGMRSWDMNTYMSVAEQASTATAQSPPAALADLAKGCIAKVLR